MSHICTQSVWILADSSLTPIELNFIVPHGFIMCTSVTFYSTERFSSLLMYRQPENIGSFVTFFLSFCSWNKLGTVYVNVEYMLGINVCQENDYDYFSNCPLK